MTDTKCPLLWNHLHISLNSIHSPCCHSQAYQDLGGWSKLNWGKFDSKLGINSEQHKLARQQMRQGIRVPMCEICYRREDRGIESPRTRHLVDYPDIDYNSEPTHVHSIDIKFDRTCNLGCRMCGPYSSSFLNRELDAIPQTDRFANEETEWDTDYAQDEKLELCKQLVKNGLRVFKTTGGEPFLQRHFVEFIDWCIETGYYKDITLRITTNLILANKKLLEKMFQFKHVYLNISCDGVGDVYEYIRYPATWKDFDEKFNIIREFRKKYDDKKMDVSVSSVLQIYNLHNVEALSNYFEGFDWQADTDCKPDGTELSIENLPKNIIDDYLEKNQQWLRLKHTNIFNYLDSLEYKNNLDEFCRKTLLYDKRRKQSYTVLDDSIVHIINTYKQENNNVESI